MGNLIGFVFDDGGMVSAIVSHQFHFLFKSSATFLAGSLLITKFSFRAFQ